MLQEKSSRRWKPGQITGFVFVAAGLLLVGMLGRPSQAALQRPTSTNVLVTNDATTPVPTQALGTTAVAGLVGLDANANTVRIDPSVPIPVTSVESAGELVQYIRTVKVPHGQTVLGNFPLVDVPAGKRLVVEHVTGQFEISPGTEFTARIGMPTMLHTLPFSQNYTTEGSSFAEQAFTSEAMTFFVVHIPGIGPELVAEIQSTNNHNPFGLVHTFTIVGRLYDVPAVQ